MGYYLVLRMSSPGPISSAQYDCCKMTQRSWTAALRNSIWLCPMQQEPRRKGVVSSCRCRQEATRDGMVPQLRLWHVDNVTCRPQLDNNSQTENKPRKLASRTIFSEYRRPSAKRTTCKVALPAETALMDVMRVPIDRLNARA